MDNRKIGSEPSQYARVLFNLAADKWYVAIIIEIISGIIALVINAISINDDILIVCAAINVLLLIVAYIFRLQFDDFYDTAETMRRQSVLSEALDWSIDSIQYSDWLQKAGKKVREKAKLNPREPDYYFTTKVVGPKRLAEMTLESAFYTRNLYKRLSYIIWLFFTIIIILLVLVQNPLHVAQ